MCELYAKRDAWSFFFPAGKGKSMVTIDPLTGKNIYWCLHHVDKTLKTNDPKRYKEWRVEDLVMITFTEHIRIHKNDMQSSTKYEKVSESLKGRVPWNKGLKTGPCKEETKLKISKKNKGSVRTPEQRKNISDATKKAMQKLTNPDGLTEEELILRRKEKRRQYFLDNKERINERKREWFKRKQQQLLEQQEAQS